MLIMVCDIDNTICDSIDRMNLITNKYNLDNQGLWRKEHIDEFLKVDYLKLDKLIPGAEILPSLARTCKAKLMFLTGRSEVGREHTRNWLRYNLCVYDSVPLIMRDDGDYTDPTECKIKIFKNTILKIHKEANFIFFDDDEKLLMEYSKYGLALKAPECWTTIKFLKKDGESVVGGFHPEKIDDNVLGIIKNWNKGE